VQRQHDTGQDLDTGLIPVTIPELLRLLRDTVIPPPRRDRPHRLYWPAWRRRHQHRARRVHQRWNAYAETTPCAAARHVLARPMMQRTGDLLGRGKMR